MVFGLPLDLQVNFLADHLCSYIEAQLDLFQSLFPVPEKDNEKKTVPAVPLLGRGRRRVRSEKISRTRTRPAPGRPVTQAVEQALRTPDEGTKETRAYFSGSISSSQSASGASSWQQREIGIEAFCLSQGTRISYTGCGWMLIETFGVDGQTLYSIYVRYVEGTCMTSVIPKAAVMLGLEISCQAVYWCRL